MTMIELRDYQHDMIDKARAAFAKGHKRVLVQLPTGGGKTFLAGFMIKNKPKRSFFIVNRIELIEQTLRSFELLGLDCGVIASGLPENPHATVQICSVDTLKSRIKHASYEADFVIWDECRGIAAAGWQKVMAHFGDNTKHLGLDATPIRTDGKPLGQFFDMLVQGLQVQQLIDMGALVPPRVFGASVAPDLSKVRTRMGEYVAEDVEDAMSSGGIAGCIVDTYAKIGESRQGLIFCPTVKYSQFIATEFTQAGYPCEHLDGETPKGKRDQIIAKYRAGELCLLSNVGLFTAGFDVPNVGYIADASPTKSLSNYLQRAGRGARSAEGKAYYIYADHAGNRFEHGFPHEDREWSLSSRKKKIKGESAKSRVRDCPECFGASPAHKKACEHCGHVFVVQSRDVVATKDELAEVHILPKLKGEDYQKALGECESHADFIALARRQGHKLGWAWYRWNERKVQRAMNYDSQQAVRDGF